MIHCNKAGIFEEEKTGLCGVLREHPEEGFRRKGEFGCGVRLGSNLHGELGANVGWMMEKAQEMLLCGIQGWSGASWDPISGQLV